jgi:hypothetical protein
MKTLIKWLVAAGIAFGSGYLAYNYVTPAPAQEAECITVEAEKIRVAESLKKAGYDDFTVTVYHNEVADAFVGNLTTALGYDSETAKGMIEWINVVVIFNAKGLDTSLVQGYDINGCRVAQDVFPNALIESWFAEADINGSA